MDAPPTGRIGRFLNVTTEVSGLARVGPIRGHADTVQRVIRSPETVVHFVTVLEEMPVQETLDGIAELPPARRRHPDRRHHRQHDPAAAAARGPAPRPPPRAGSTPDELALGLKAAGLDDSRAPGRRARGRAGQRTPGPPWASELQRARLDEPGQPCYELPWISDGIDLGGLYRLAAALRDQGAA